MTNYILVSEVLQRWGCSPHEIYTAVKSGLGLYEPDIHEKVMYCHIAEHAESITWDAVEFPDNNKLERCYFDISELERYEIGQKINLPGESLNAREKRHYGILKIKDESFSDALRAAVDGLLYCQTDKPVKAAFLNYIESKYSLTNTTLEELWRVIPQEFKSGPGRPKK